jgi:transposase InsO family protein
MRREKETMSASTNDIRQAVALFRYGLIALLLKLPPKSEALRRQMAEIASREHTIPATTRTRVAPGTLREWLRLYRQGGFEALVPKARADRGRPRVLPPEVVDLLLSIKEGNRQLSVRLVIDQARASGQVADDLALPPSTVHRLFERHGLMAPPTGVASPQDRRRFAFERAGQLWTSDVMHGPAVRLGDRTQRKTYLIAFLDDATRVAPHAAFALSENTQAFLAVFKQAILRRGLSERLYVDNGSSFRSRHLSLVCAKLGIALIHSRPYQPQGRGKIERFFRTVRGQLLTRLTPEDTTSLDALNRRLGAWIAGEYHEQAHRALGGDTPLERWAQSGEFVRYPEPSLDLDDLFLFETERRVQKDRTVSLDGVVYEVDAAFIGERVTLRYDPATPGAPVQVCHRDHPVELARRVDLYANCYVKRDRPSHNLATDQSAPEPPRSGLRLRERDEESH